MKLAAAAADIMLTVVDMNIGNERNGTLSVPSMRGRKASRTDYTKTHTIGTQSRNFDDEKARHESRERWLIPTCINFQVLRS